MPDDPVKRMVDVIQALRRVRSRIEKGWSDRADARAIYASIQDDVFALDGAMHDLRQFAPGVGEVWDTFRSLWGLCIDMNDVLKSTGQGGQSEGLHPAVPAADT